MFNDFFRNQQVKLNKHNDQLIVISQQRVSTPGARVKLLCELNTDYLLKFKGYKRVKKQITQVHLWVNGHKTGVLSYKETELGPGSREFLIEFNSGKNKYVDVGFLFYKQIIGDKFVLTHFEIERLRGPGETWDGEELDSGEEEQWPFIELTANEN